jgi:hypothetical protein
LRIGAGVAVADVNYVEVFAEVAHFHPEFSIVVACICVPAGTSYIGVFAPRVAELQQAKRAALDGADHAVSVPLADAVLGICRLLQILKSQ